MSSSTSKQLRWLLAALTQLFESGTLTQVTMLVAVGDLAVEVECQPLENWKLSFPDRNIVTCG